MYKGEKTELRPVSGTAFGYRFERRAIEEGRERVAERHWTLDFPGGSDGKASACNAGDPGSIPGLGKYPGEGKGYSLQYSGLKNLDFKESNRTERLSLSFPGSFTSVV